jgi:NADPH:quinone reductase-like Zn-dependent oxidoreductase
MKAIVVEASGSLPHHADFVEPVARSGELLINVTASALSPLTRGRAAGSHYSSHGQFPFVVGVDGVGRLEDGTRGYFLLPRAPFGSMAERTVVLESHWLRLPDNLDDIMAATIANPGMSSWAALCDRAKLQAGETVLINGATGAAGTLAVKIARHLGAARVIATGRNEDVLNAIGADAIVPLNGDAELLEARLRDQFAAGIDVVLDYLWGASAKSILVAGAQAAPDGVPIRFVQVGSAAGGEITMPAAILRSSSIEMKGSGIGSVSFPRLLAAIEAVFRSASDAKLSLDYREVSLREVGKLWNDSGERIVYSSS